MLLLVSAAADNKTSLLQHATKAIKATMCAAIIPVLLSRKISVQCPLMCGRGYKASNK
jgi:hypothetical protein